MAEVEQSRNRSPFRHIPDNQGIPRRVYPSSSIMSELFEGVMDQDEESIRPNVCLHEEFSPDTQPQVSYDIDSMLAFPRTLRALIDVLRPILWEIMKDMREAAL